MKIEEARGLKKGDKVCFRIGNGWYQHAIFLGLVKTVQFPRMTLGDLMNGKFSLENGKEVLMADIKYRDDNGKERRHTISIRRLQTAGDGVIWINGRAR